MGEAVLSVHIIYPASHIYIHQQQWKIGTDWSIAISVDCLKYYTRSLVISAIEDGNIGNYKSVYYSFVNHATGLALLVEGTGYNIG